MDAEGDLGIAPTSLHRAKDRLRQITKRNRAISLEQMIGEANSFLSGWVTYFRYAHAHSQLRGLDGWLRRKLRCVRLKHCKQPAGLRRFLCQHGVSPRPARELASSGRGWWCLANSLQAKIAMNIAWFDQLGLINLTARHAALNAQGTQPARRGSVPEIVEHGVTGLIVDSVDEAVAAVPLARTLDRVAIRRRFEERFSVGRMARDYLALYDAVSDACPPLDSEAGSEGRRLISLEGGNRGPA